MSESIKWGNLYLARETDHVSGLAAGLDRLTQTSRPLRSSAAKARDRGAGMVTLRWEVTKAAFANETAARRWLLAFTRELQAVDSADAGTLTWDFAASGGAFVATVADAVVRLTDSHCRGAKVALTFEATGGLITSPDPDSIT